MKKLSLVLTLFLFVVSLTFAQREVVGTVTDSDGEALIGASVLVKGTSSGTVTDIDGNYSVQVPEGANTLVFSYTGYDTKEVELGASNVVNVTLDEGITLETAVVTALGITRQEKSLGYAVQEVDGDAMQTAREVNVINSLSGKVAGVQVTGSGNFGGTSKIIIRGNNSILGSNNPLFVVDGIPLDNSNETTHNQKRGAGGYDYGNAAQDINPDDIESVNVLKGAAATALYGSRGSNGVVLITTKKGTKGKGLGVTINSGLSFQDILVFPDYQNRYGGGANDEFAVVNGELIPDYGYDGSWGPPLEGQMVRHWDSWYEGSDNFGELRPWSPSPNNVENFFVTGLTSNQNIAIDGGNESTAFRVSYTNTYVEGTQENSTLKRNNLSLNLSSDLTDNLYLKTSINYVGSNALGRPITGYGESIMSQFNQWFQRQVDMDRLRDYKTADGTQRTWNITDPVNGDLSPHYWNNPYWERYENYQDDNRNRVFGNVRLGYEFTDWLRLEGAAMLDRYTEDRRERFAVGSIQIPKYSEDVYRISEQNYELMLHLNKRLSSDFSLSAFVGGNIRENDFERNYAATRDGLNVPGFYNLSNSSGTPDITDETREKVTHSAFGSASIGFRDYLYLDITGRYDWASSLPEGENPYFYPSVSASFVFSELMNVSFIDFGKIRASWARVSADTGPYRLGTTFSPHDNFGTTPLYSLPNALNNPALKSEETTSYEVGLEFRLANNRIGFNGTYYNSETDDLIFNVAQSGASGYSSRFLNAGRVSNKGFELQFDVTPVQVRDFSWNIGLNFATNDNLLEELYEDPTTGIKVTNLQLASLFGVAQRAVVGEPLWSFYGTDYMLDDNGNRLVDANGVYLTTPGIVNIGNTQPDFTGGLFTTLTFKGISLYALIDFQEGGTIHSYSNQWGKYSGVLAETAEGDIRENGTIVEGVYAPGTVIDGEDVSGQPNRTTVDAQTHFFLNGGYILHAADQYDASFVKFRELRLSYSIPDQWLSNAPIRDIVVSFVGRNLAIISKDVPHVDPEAGLSLSNIQGFEGGQLPSQRSLGVNLRLKF